MAKIYENAVPGLVIRQAQEEDCAAILELIWGLAKYEKLEHQVVATEESLRESIFVRRRADVLLAEYEGKTVGYALYFYNFSTFIGRENLYLEDIFSSCRKCGERASAKPCSPAWRASPWNRDAAAWIGSAWIGTPRPRNSISPWALSPIRNGCCSGQRETP